jgi:hypothetical protein
MLLVSEIVSVEDAFEDSVSVVTSDDVSEVTVLCVSVDSLLPDEHDAKAEISIHIVRIIDKNDSLLFIKSSFC